MKIAEDIIYVGVNDKERDLFEGQYKLSNGVTYNSYLIKDEKIAILDTVDSRASDKWLENIQNALEGKEPDYLVILHMEPDHSSNIKTICEKYPNMKLVGNQKTFAFLPQFFEIENFEEKQVLVKEGDVLDLGKHKLHFVMAPMVHWPEVMVEYEETEKILFSADAFGSFGIIKDEEGIPEKWLETARRYYINIVGKYGIQVQALLKKAEALDIKMICPLHGPALKSNLDFYIQKYDTWSKYEPEEDGIVIACGSMHGHTLEAMKELESLLKEAGKKVELIDLTREDKTEAVSEAFRYKTLVLSAPTYNAELFPAMDDFLRLLKAKNYQNKKVAFVENGTWAPMSAKLMADIIAQMKNIEIVEPTVTIRTRLNNESREKLKELSNAL